MSSEDSPAPATIAGAEQRLAQLDREVETLSARGALALEEMHRQLRAPIVLSGAEEADLPPDVLTAMLRQREARVTAAARAVAEDVKRGLTVALTELATMGTAFTPSRFVRELSTSEAAASVRAALADAPSPELAAHIDEAVARDDVAVAVTAASLLAHRSDVPGATRKRAGELLAGLRFPQRERLVGIAERIRANAANGLLPVVNLTDGNDAAASRASIARKHIKPGRLADGLEVRPPLAPIWGE